MPASEDFAVVNLLWQLLNSRTGELGRVDFKPQKPAFDDTFPIRQALPRSTPERQGVDSMHIANFVDALGREKSVHIHQVMVLRHGHIIYEGGYDPYKAGVWHVTYSLCKSITNMAVGLLIDDGKLSLTDHLTDILSDEWSQAHPPLLSIMRYHEITIRHLLTMSTGVAFNEAGAVSGNDWVHNYLGSGVKFKPGTKFEYNSMNSFMLSAVVSKITHMSMFEFLKERLFKPLGIDKVFWEASPLGITKGGWGLFLTQEDAAKLGLLYMHEGMYRGKQIISKEWVRESTKKQIDTGDGGAGYGYHIWVDSRPDSFIFNGMLGQDMHCYRDIDMIVITNAGNQEVFTSGVMTSIVHRYFNLPYKPSDQALSDDKRHFRHLLFVKKEWEGDAPQRPVIVRGGWRRPAALNTGASSIQTLLHKVNGKTYHMNENGVGLFPLIMQVVHNNYTWGISDLTFRYEKGILNLEFQEGKQLHVLPVGFGKGRHTTIDMNGEKYIVGTKGRFAFNEDGLPVLALEIAFIEEATARTLKIVFRDPDNIELHWSESPGDVIITNTVEQITLGSGNAGFLTEQLMKNVTPAFISRTMQATVQPVVEAKVGELPKKTEAEIDYDSDSELGD